jgi:hypothetical protein
MVLFIDCAELSGPLVNFLLEFGRSDPLLAKQAGLLHVGHQALAIHHYSFVASRFGKTVGISPIVAGFDRRWLQSADVIGLTSGAETS